MSKSDETVDVGVSEELVQRVDDCFEERGFDSRIRFIESAIRDALNQEDPFTEEAREDIRRAREAYERGETTELDPDELFEE